MKTKMFLAGGRGFLGSVLADYFIVRGMEVVIFTRASNPRRDDARGARWDGETEGDWGKELEGARGVVNLAGISVN